MSGFRFTPSAGPRLEKCLGSAVLPNVDESWESSERGRVLHGYMEKRATGYTRAEALEPVPEKWRDDAERIDVPEDVDKGCPEVAMALDLSTGAARVLGERMTREAARKATRPGEIAMVPDWIALSGSCSAVLRDWKMGRQEDLAPAAEHLQLLTYAATALLAYNLETVRAELWHWDGLRWWVDGVTLDWLEADAVLERVRGLLARAEKAREAHARDKVLPRLSVGAWCSWCPSRRACPAVAAPVDMALGRCGEWTETTPAGLGAAYEALLQAQAWIDERLADVRRLAESGPLPLPSGKVLRLQEVETRKVDVAAALPVLEARFGAAVAQAAVKRTESIPWQHLNDALREVGLPKRLAQHKEGRKPSAAALAREAREALVAAGAVKLSTHTQLCEVRAELVAGEAENEET